MSLEANLERKYFETQKIAKIQFWNLVYFWIGDFFFDPENKNYISEKKNTFPVLNSVYLISKSIKSKVHKPSKFGKTESPKKDHKSKGIQSKRISKENEFENQIL